LHALQWLKGPWAHQPRFEQYQGRIKKDHRWFLENIAAGDFPNSLRREKLLSGLESEFRQLASENPAVREFLGNYTPDILLIVAM
jgi:hypothetical protein